MKLRIRWIVVSVLLIGGACAYFLLSRDEKLDTRFTGAYRLDDGRLVLIVPREGDNLRYRLMSGESAVLRPAGERTFEAGPGWSAAEPVVVTITFEAVEASSVYSLTWSAADGKQKGRRIDLLEVRSSFPSGELELRAKLVLPEGEGPFPAVVFVHGSESESAVDTYYNPYLAAAHGVAGVAYDKRGTGGSEGKYNQNFHLLSDDTAAAVAWLRTRPEIDPENIHLAGYSQGGWVAPLAATKTVVRSLLIGYGPMVPVTGEDRWGYVYALEQAGFGQDAVGEVDAINAIIGDVMDHGRDRWGELGQALAKAERAEWYDTVRGSDSMVGFLTESSLPLSFIRSWVWWRMRRDEPFIDRLYDPVPIVDSLQVPSLWIFGDADSSMPSTDSISKLESLQAAGRPIVIQIFPEAEHGILLFSEESGERTYLGYPRRYLPLQVEWLRRQSGMSDLQLESERLPSQDADQKEAAE